jgi:predicted ATPase/class 3 adenylate cyclase/DNA-binding CsgD family transcriptional regulator
MDEKKSPTDPLVEPLTRRERAILNLLAEGKSNAEIALSESLSLNTVKWYNQLIYGKLGVNKRSEAIERARNLGLLAAPGSISLTELPSTEMRTQPLPTSTSYPVGTVTFLFTDIEGSTSVWETHPEKMAGALQIHNSLLHQAIEIHGGVVYKTVGDSLQAAFPTAPQALMAAIAGQQTLQTTSWNEPGPLKVRMGLHTGEAELDPGGDEYTVSHTKNRVARIMSVAYGGQILLSAETAELVDHQLPDGVSLKDLGEQRLKGMARSEHLFQVVVSDLLQEFPPLETTITHPNNLPLQMTSFIGRENEIVEIRRLLAGHRLVTLTGSGGTGKTRLALQVASQVFRKFLNGAWLVELAPLVDPTLVPKTVASALGVPETAGRDIRDSLVDFLRQKQLLLVLDNCEHLLQSCANLVDHLLHACLGLTILASSREILGVEGETPFRIPSMTLPDLCHLPSLEELPRYDAIRLFVERGNVVSPGFAITAGNAPVIAQVVSRLDGIPLAIELAAARLRLLSVDQIASRLNDAFHLLTGGSRTALPRHQTLRASIDWSYNLLSEAERILLHRLSVFAGSWTLEAAEQVCADEGQVLGAILPLDIIDLLGGLVDKCLIQSASSFGGLNRFVMLETVRQYAHEKLVDEKEAATVRTRHMQYFFQLVEELAPKIRSQEQIDILDRLEIELGNLRLALEWGLQTDIEAELTLASALKWLWHIRTHWSEGIEWLERGLEFEVEDRGAAAPGSRRVVIRADALSVLGFLLQMQVNFVFGKELVERTKTCLEESIALFQSSGNENTPGCAWAILFSGFYSDQPQIQGQKALGIFRKIGDPHGTAEALLGLSFFETDPAQKRRFLQEQLEIDQANGDTEGIAAALWYISLVDCQDAEWEQAFQSLKASQSHFRRVHNPNMLGTVSIWLAISLFHNGDLLGAEHSLNEALNIYSELGNEYGLTMCWWLRSRLKLSEGLFPQATEAIDQLSRMNLANAPSILAVRARLARLQGDASQAQQLAREGLQISREAKNIDTDILLELGYQALECDDLPGATSYWTEGIQHLILRRDILPWESYLDGLTLLAARQNNAEFAVRLFGTRWCQGYFHMLSPFERAVRTAIQAEVQSLLGEERHRQLSQEGRALTFIQMQAAVREFLKFS